MDFVVFRLVLLTIVVVRHAFLPVSGCVSQFLDGFGLCQIGTACVTSLLASSMHCLYKHVSSFVFAVTVARCVLASEQAHSSFENDVSCCLKLRMDDSQADALSEGSWQDQVPSPGQELFDEPEEVEVRVSAALPAADAPEFIEALATGEDNEAEVPEGYFQRRWHGKQSIKRQIRKFLITGWCKWRG